MNIEFIKQNYLIVLYLQKSTQWNHGHVKKASRLFLPKVTQKDAGQYICIASNDVGAPAKQEITLRVHCKFIH